VKHKGKPPRLSPAQAEAVTVATRGKVVTLAKIGEYIFDKYGVRLGKTRICQLSQAHGWQGHRPHGQRTGELHHATA